MTEALNAAQWLALAGDDQSLAASLLPGLPVFARAAAFHAQQCAEHALKAVLIHLEANVPRTHEIGKLLEAVRHAGADAPPGLNAVAVLTAYAVELRYAAVETVSAEEVRTAVRLASLTLEWARAQIAARPRE